MSYINQISSLGPKVWYRFNETAGTPVNSGSLSTTSTFNNLLLNEQTDVDGRAIYLNGSSSYIQLPAHAQFALFNDRSFTVECWVKTDQNGEIFRLNAPSSPHYVVALQINNGKASLVSSWTTTINGTTTITDNVWHHVVYTYNTSSVKLYVDGILEASTTPTNLIPSFNFDQSTKKLIGAGYGGISQATITGYFKGRIDEFAAYDYELTSTNILDNYNAGASVTYATEVLGTATALMLQPTVFASFNPAAQAPMTASAASGDHYNSTVDFPTLIDTYMSGLTLETWYKFNTFQQLTNYGSLATKVSIFETDAFTDPATGIQGSGVLRTTGGTNGAVTNLSDNVGPLIADKDFSYGFWVKKTTKEQAQIVFFLDIQDQEGDSISTYWNTDGGITTDAYFNNTSHLIESTTDITDGNWHYVAVRQSGNTLEMWVDNTSIGTDTITQSYSDLDTVSFGNGTTTITEKMYISQFYVATAANVTSTEIGNIYNANSSGEVQASAYMPEARAKFNSAFNDYIVSKSPLLDIRLDEGSGAPLDYGSAGLILVSQQSPQGYTQGTNSLNTKAFRFTDRLQAIRGNYSFDSGTLSSANLCTIGVLFKSANATNIQAFAGFGGRGGTAGTGFSLQQLASSGYLRIIAGNSDGTTNFFTGTTNVADNKWHLAVIVKEASTIKLYIDGKLDITASSSNTLTDAGEFAIAAISAIDAATASRDTLIDEIFVTAGTFTQQEAFEAWQSLRLEMDTTATALMVDPTTILGTGNIYTADPATASADIVEPTEEQEIAPTIATMNAHAVFLYPNFGGNVVIDVNYGTQPFTADALFHPPGFSVGEINSATDMEASALMVHPISIAGGTISVNPFIALDATLVDPGIVTIKGALVKAQTLNANAFAPLPPQYFSIADDLWYQRLVAIDEKSPDVDGKILFFNTSDNFGVGHQFEASGFEARTAYNQIPSPVPTAYGGYFDGQNRKALNFRNINLTSGYTAGNIGVGDRDFTFEAMIKTTKSNQVLFAGENESSANFQRTGIILKDGKLALTQSKDRRLGNILTSDFLSFVGFKNIADGEWHHIIIQNRQTGIDQTQPRIQFWVDGELDIQRYGYEMYVINQIGFNSADPDSYSDFFISAAAINGSSMVESNEINLNYLAAFNIIPVKAPVATATATATPNNKGRGNRGRALMLYFWPTQNAATGIYAPTSAKPTFNVVGNNFHNFDQGGYGNDPDTFYQLSTYLNQGANKFYDWDIWPCPVVSIPAGDKFVGESHPILKDDIFKTGTDKGTVYVNPVTDNERYLNLMTDFKDLSQFDMICFRNYPDQSNEQDQYGVNAKGVADGYFNLLDKDLFDEFLKSLREAVDTGISLLITNPQLAVDMGFIDTYHTVPDLNKAGNTNASDPYVPIKLNNPYGDGSETYSFTYPTKLTNPEEGNIFRDSYRNNYHEVVNTLTDLTDDAAFIWTDWINYDVDGSEYGELDRWWSHIEYKNGLQAGDRFLFSTTKSENQSYFATPISAIRAGKVITKFADTYYFGTSELVNPYRNYATSIAVEPGTVVAGRQIGAKVFISFTDVVGVQQGGSAASGVGFSIEQQSVLLNSAYWISYAYSVGAISVTERDRYLAAINAQPVDWTQLTSTDTPYWTLDGSTISGQLQQFGDNDQVTADTAEAVRTGRTPGRTRKNKRKTVASTGFLPAFQIVWGWGFQTLSINVPSINTRALWWLSERLEYGDDIPKRPEHFSASAFMPQPVITGFKTVNVNAQAAVAVAAIVETNLRSADVVIGVLPLTATALFAERGRIIAVDVATASAETPQNIGVTTLESDQVILYLVHVDPILYLREEVIK